MSAPWKAAIVPLLVFAAWLAIEVGLTLASTGGPVHP